MWTTSCIQDNSQTIEKKKRVYIYINLRSMRDSRWKRNLRSRPTISYKIVGSRSNYFFNPGQNFDWNFLFHANFRTREKEIALVDRCNNRVAIVLRTIIGTVSKNMLACECVRELHFSPPRPRVFIIVTLKANFRFIIQLLSL